MVINFCWLRARYNVRLERLRLRYYAYRIRLKRRSHGSSSAGRKTRAIRRGSRERERDCWRASFTTRVSLALFNNYSQGCRCVETVVSIHSGKTSPWQMEQMFWRDPLVRPGLLCHSNVTIDVNHWLDRHCWFVIRRCQHFSPSPGGGFCDFLFEIQKSSRSRVDRRK